MDEITEKAENTGENEKVYFLVIEYIKELVKKGDVKFGGKIPSERELMSTLGLSRNSIREALRTLENMGLLECRQGQGNFLVNHVGQSLSSLFSLLLFMKESNYVEISQLRRFIEIGAFLLAVKNPDQKDREELKEILDKIDQCQDQEKVKLDKQFHDHLILISGNHLLVLLNEALSELFETMISDYTQHITQKNWDRLLACHRRVYDCLEKNDVQEGMKAIREHYNIIDEDLIEYQVGEWEEEQKELLH